MDDVLQISNIFVNVSKGELAKHQDLQKAFGKAEQDDIVKEVSDIPVFHWYSRLNGYIVYRS